MRHPAAAATRACARPGRGAFVGAASGAVSIAAHAIGGGVVAPGDASVAMLVGACALIGVVVGVLSRGRSGLGGLALQLIAGQAVGHTALTLGPGHTHGSHAEARMLVAHMVAIPVGALLIRAAETALAAAAAGVRGIVRVLSTRPTAAQPVRSISTGAPARIARRLLLSSGLGTRGPPAYT
ncbi:hypothetical protein ACFVMC_32400 [Nocardia sp. NPDC127579]|uniref:hypothetical protein n=1 Tax=Nocardia sp. NPDC127579 TaxID=3345402 RepID=UPI0036288659